jgi:putative hydrolase of the HAD superfamily
VHVPYEITWAMEHADAPVAHPRFKRVEHLRELADLIAKMGA